MRNNKRGPRTNGKLLLEVGDAERKLLEETQALIGAANPLQVMTLALSTYRKLAQAYSTGSILRIVNPDRSIDYLELLPSTSH